MPEVKKNLDKKTNSFVQGAKPSQILSLNKEFKKIDNIVLLTVGEPDFNTPEHIKKAAIADIQANDSHYGPSSGTPELLQSVADFLKNHDIFVISDEIYSELTYDRPHSSFAAALLGQTILFNGVSKSHAMTGYRLGIIAGPQAIISQIAVIHQLITTALPDVVMAAATEAFSAGENDAATMRVEYKKRRDYLIDAFTKLDISFAYPDGAFYFFFKIPDYLEQDGFKLARQIAEEAKVGLTPGVAFGQAGYLRLSYAASLDQIKIAVNRLSEFFSKQKQAQAKIYEKSTTK
ncbi:aminotransferase class I/II-fold pyridoxal phosphate-dependent enzyme [Oenococcus oeni]